MSEEGSVVPHLAGGKLETIVGNTPRGLLPRPSLPVGKGGAGRIIDGPTVKKTSRKEEEDVRDV